VIIQTKDKNTAWLVVGSSFCITSKTFLQQLLMEQRNFSTGGQASFYHHIDTDRRKHLHLVGICQHVKGCLQE